MKHRLREAAALIGISYSHLRVLIKQRRIGCEDLGYRTKFIYQSEIDSFLKNNNRPRLT